MRRIGKLFSGALVGAMTITGLALCLANSSELKSGVGKGGMLSAFNPMHVSGPDKNTNTCPVCKYPTNPAVQVWVNTDDEKNVTRIVNSLEKVARANADKKFKAFVVFINPDREAESALSKHLTDLATKNKVEKVAIAYLPNPDADPVKEYAINTDSQIKNTIFVYKNRKVHTKFVNLVADKKGIEELDVAIKDVLK